MNTPSKYNGNVKMSLLQILLKSSLVVGLSACSSAASKEESTQIIKGKKSMLSEIYQTKTSPSRAEIVKNIVTKYFPIGMDKTTVLTKLDEMNLEYTINTQKTLIKVVHHNQMPFAVGHTVFEAYFHINVNNKLSDVSCRVYNTI